MANNVDRCASATSPSSEMLLHMLDEWLNLAHDRMSIRLDVFAATATLADELWIYWCVPTDGSFSIKDIEAMELLELLAHVDLKAAWMMVFLLAGSSVHRDHVLDTVSATETGVLYPRFQISGLAQTSRKGTFKQIAQWLLFAIDDTEHSHMYYPVRQTLLQCWKDRLCLCRREDSTARCERPDRSRISIRLDLELNKLTSVYDVQQLLTDAAIVAALTEHPTRLELYPTWQPNRSSQSRSRVFTVDHIYVDFSVARVTDARFWSTRELSLSLARLWFEYARPQCSPLATAQFFREMVMGNPAVWRPTRLTLCKDTPIWEFEAACSAICKSHSVRDVTIRRRVIRDEASQNCRRSWSWIAYAVFSREARHAIQRLTLSMGGLTRDHTIAFERVLTARDPLVPMCTLRNGADEARSCERTSRKPASVTVCAGATVLIGNPFVEMSTGNTTCRLRVVDDNPPSMEHHVCVVYPGAGICYVHRSQIVDRPRRAKPQPTRSTHVIPHLCVEITESTDLDEVQRILALVGSGLQSLAVHGTNDEYLSSAFLRGVFEACPLLVRLDLMRVELDDFDWLERYGAALESLVMIDVVVEPGYRPVFAKIAAGVTSLTELFIRSQAPTLTMVMDDILAMLDSSDHAIERLVFAVQDGENVPVRLARQLKKRSGMALPGPKAPLAVRCKVAFLSVMDVLPALAAIDAAVVAMVFGFAAPHKTRVCGFAE